MAAMHSLAIPAAADKRIEAMDPAQPWVSDREPMLPAAQVILASAALIGAALLVLLAA